MDAPAVEHVSVTLADAPNSAAVALVGVAACGRLAESIVMSLS